MINNPISFIDPLGLNCTGSQTVVVTPRGTTFGPLVVSDCVPPGGAGGDSGSGIPLIFKPGGQGGEGGNGNSTDTNDGFTLGIRTPDETWSQCMSANANTYSIGGATELTVNVATGTSSNISEKTSIVTGNGITGLIFDGPGPGDLLTAAGAGAGSPLTFGRRTSDVMSLNLAGKGGLPQALGSTGAKGFFETAGNWLSFGLDEAEKIAVDAGLAGAESINCAIPR